MDPEILDLERSAPCESRQPCPDCSTIVARKDGKAYAMDIPYKNEVRLTDQIYEMMMARNLAEMKTALGHLQLMAQNIMVGTVEGDIYYVRNGRVPIRAKGCDPGKPMPGNTSDCEWKGIHPFTDLVQITNPPQGYMQNNNISPFAMMFQQNWVAAVSPKVHNFFIGPSNEMTQYLTVTKQ